MLRVTSLAISGCCSAQVHGLTSRAELELNLIPRGVLFEAARECRINVPVLIARQDERLFAQMRRSI